LEEPDRDLLFFLFGSGPGVEDGLLLEIEVVVLDLQSLINLDIEEGGRIEGYVDVDILLVVEAALQIEDAELGGYFQQFQDVLVGLFIFYVSQVFAGVDVLQHEVFIVLDRELVLLLH
jgi:hypothetical protein